MKTTKQIATEFYAEGYKNTDWEKLESGKTKWFSVYDVEQLQKELDRFM